MEQEEHKEQKPTILEGFVSISLKEYERLKQREQDAITWDSTWNKKEQEFYWNKDLEYREKLAALRSDFEFKKKGEKLLMKDEKRRLELEMIDKLNLTLSEIKDIVPHLRRLGFFSRLFFWKNRVDKISKKYKKQYDSQSTYKS